MRIRFLIPIYLLITTQIVTAEENASLTEAFCSADARTFCKQLSQHLRKDQDSGFISKVQLKRKALLEIAEKQGFFAGESASSSLPISKIQQLERQIKTGNRSLYLRYLSTVDEMARKSVDPSGNLLSDQINEVIETLRKHISVMLLPDGLLRDFDSSLSSVQVQALSEMKEKDVPEIVFYCGEDGLMDRAVNRRGRILLCPGLLISVQSLGGITGGALVHILAHEIGHQVSSLTGPNYFLAYEEFGKCIDQRYSDVLTTLYTKNARKNVKREIKDLYKRDYRLSDPFMNELSADGWAALVLGEMKISDSIWKSMSFLCDSSTADDLVSRKVDSLNMHPPLNLRLSVLRDSNYFDLKCPGLDISRSCRF